MSHVEDAMKVVRIAITFEVGLVVFSSVAFGNIYLLMLLVYGTPVL